METDSRVVSTKLVLLKCSGWCIPVIIYVVLAAIVLVLTMMSPVPWVAKLFPILVTIVWSALVILALYLICRSCQPAIAWYIFLLPLIFFIILVILVFIFGGIFLFSIV